eukprot:2712419-Rhodomonas_salina.1
MPVIRVPGMDLGFPETYPGTNYTHNVVLCTIVPGYLKCALSVSHRSLRMLRITLARALG